MYTVKRFYNKALILTKYEKGVLFTPIKRDLDITFYLFFSFFFILTI